MSSPSRLTAKKFAPTGVMSELCQSSPFKTMRLRQLPTAVDRLRACSHNIEELIQDALATKEDLRTQRKKHSGYNGIVPSRSSSPLIQPSLIVADISRPRVANIRFMRSESISNKRNMFIFVSPFQSAILTISGTCVFVLDQTMMR